MKSPGVAIRHIFFALVAGTLLPALQAQAQWSVPDDLEAAVTALTDDQQAFITSGRILDFIPDRQLEHELTTRDTAAMSRLVDDVMALADDMAYDPERDMGAIPYNLTVDSFNMLGPLPESLRGFRREAGPFSVHRYLYPKSGVPTFGGAKIALYPEDLVAGDVDVAIVGAPSNLSSGRRDAIWGPDRMRALDTIADPDILSLIRPFDALSVVDYGNLAVDNMSVERTAVHVTNMIAGIANTGAIPAIVGGDSSLLYPGVKGVAQTRGAGSFGLLHFSAHPDSDRQGDHTLSDRQALFRLLDQKVVEGEETIQVGLRGPDVNAETLQWLRDQGVRYHTMAEIQRRGVEDVLRRVRREVQRGPDAFFVSIDVSAVDPADLVAAGRAVANGLGLEQVTQVIREVCASKEVVGFEITDLAPYLDVSPQSVMHANAILNACINGIAVRKSGLDPDYIHPLTLDHGQR